MPNKHHETSDSMESKLPSGPEVDYSPKTYTLRKQILMGLKLFIIAGMIFFLFWLAA